MVTRHATEPGLSSVCVRDVQESLEQSVFKLVAETIDRLGIGSMFHLAPSERRIDTPGGGVITFKGMNDFNAVNIKSLEGYDIAWWEEAQTATQGALDLLRPTIRKPGSQIWFTWNPRLRSDPVDRMMRQDPAFEDERTVVRINWDQNPYMSDEMHRERRVYLKGDPERYRHVWEGDYESESDTQFIGGGMVRTAMSRPATATIGDELVLGVDVARFGDDSTVLWLRRGRDARSIAPIVMRGADTMAVAAQVMALMTTHRPDATFIDEGGVGGGVVDRCRQMGFSVMGINFGGKADRIIEGAPKCANKKAEMWASMRMWLDSGGAIPDDPAIEMDLTGPRYSYDVNNAILIEKKSDMKKRGASSPDRAEALCLTFAYPAVGRSMQVLKDERELAEYDPIWS